MPPFDSAEAKAILARELRVSGGAQGLSSVFRSLSDAPLAAASIGQVYKGELFDGRQVAVKVQRPRILEEIAIDLYLLRLLAPLQTRISNAVNKVPTYPEDITLATALVDEWGRGFVAETDYLYEAANTRARSPPPPSATAFSHHLQPPPSATAFSRHLTAHCPQPPLTAHRHRHRPPPPPPTATAHSHG